MSVGPGTMIGQNVCIMHVLGEGGMGTVWLAEHLTLKTHVAVKFMSPDLAKDPQSVARFEMEAMAAAKMKSRHVVQTYDFGVASIDAACLPYIVMERLEGEDLSQRIDRGPMTIELWAEVVSQACKGLAVAHAHGIIHRDVKPENVFLANVDGELTVKLLDFGIAKHANTSFRATSTGLMMGTPLYMSPEQMMSAKHVDTRSDLWSLGVVAYHALTGCVPFNGETLGAICIAIDRGDYVPASELRPDLPRAVDAWFARAITKNPSARFSSAAEMGAELFLAISMAPPRASFASEHPPAVSMSVGEAHEHYDQAEITADPTTIPDRRRSDAPMVAVLAFVATILVVGGAAIAILSHHNSTQAAIAPNEAPIALPRDVAADPAPIATVDPLPANVIASSSAMPVPTPTVAPKSFTPAPAVPVRPKRKDRGF
jgi:serine/threonine protein kinase